VVKNIAKKINLSPRDKPKSKKPDKYSEHYSTKREYTYNLNDRVVYLGAIGNYHGSYCNIIKRSRIKNLEHYKVRFDNDEELPDITSGFLRSSLEEYELEKENNNENEATEEELKILEKGLIPHKNLKSCLSPIIYYQRRCHECVFEDRCIYINKYKYKVII